MGLGTGYSDQATTNSFGTCRERAGATLIPSRRAAIPTFVRLARLLRLHHSAPPLDLEGTPLVARLPGATWGQSLATRSLGCS